MSLSFMRRDPGTPNGLTEFMVVKAIELLGERGAQEMSLNFAAFARWLHSPRHVTERALGRLIALGNPFFQIESLYRFNAKFFPRWEPRYSSTRMRWACRGPGWRRCGPKVSCPSRWIGPRWR
jgi:lysyl-tRNA synthetase, class II